MSVRKFLLPVSSPASAAGALQTGLMLAKRWQAHLQVLHIRTAQEFAPFVGEGMTGAMIEDMMSATERATGARERSLEELLELAAEEAGVHVGEALRRQDEPSASFTMLTGREDELIAHRARLADLTIVPHPQA